MIILFSLVRGGGVAYRVYYFPQNASSKYTINYSLHKNVCLQEHMFFLLAWGGNYMDKIIFHIDVNSAFLSWEAVYHLRHLDYNKTF